MNSNNLKTIFKHKKNSRPNSNTKKNRSVEILNTCFLDEISYSLSILKSC